MKNNFAAIPELRYSHPVNNDTTLETNEHDNPQGIWDNEDDNINTGQVISVKDGVAFVTGLKLLKSGRW